MSTSAGVEDAPHQHPAGDDIDLSQIVRSLWQHRLLLVAFVVLGGLLGTAASLASRRHVVEGLFLSPDITLGKFKKYEVALGNRTRLEDFLEAMEIGAADAKVLLDLSHVPGGIENAVQPVFSITGKDARTYDIRPEDSGEVVGIQLRIEHGDGPQGGALRALAEYVRSTMIRLDLGELALEKCLDFASQRLELRNEQIDSDFRARQMGELSSQLRALIDGVPGAAELRTNQVVTLVEGNERFLAPTAQLFAAEVGAYEEQMESRARDRRLLAAELQQSFYCEARELFAQQMTGRQILGSLAEVKAKLFEPASGQADSEPRERTANELEVLLQKWNSAYLERTRFVVPPEGAERHGRKVGLIGGTFIGALLGGLVGVLLALLMAWWRSHRAEIVAPD